MRIGIGYDIHRLVEDRKLILGGVEIPYVKGLLGYSDGDVLLHAISDALLGALALGDIGQHFPNTDTQYKDISSIKILNKAMEMVRGRGYAINNLDTMIIAEEPKIHPFRSRMIGVLADIMGAAKGDISIKATTNEEVGSLGRGDAIAAYAVVTLAKKRCEVKHGYLP